MCQYHLPQRLPLTCPSGCRSPAPVATAHLPQWLPPTCPSGYRSAAPVAAAHLPQWLPLTCHKAVCLCLGHRVSVNSSPESELLCDHQCIGVPHLQQAVSSTACEHARVMGVPLQFEHSTLLVRGWTNLTHRWTSVGWGGAPIQVMDCDDTTQTARQ